MVDSAFDNNMKSLPENEQTKFKRRREKGSVRHMEYYLSYVWEHRGRELESLDLLDEKLNNILQGAKTALDLQLGDLFVRYLISLGGLINIRKRGDRMVVLVEIAIDNIDTLNFTHYSKSIAKALLLNYKSTISFFQEDYDQSIKISVESLRTAQAENDIVGILSNYQNIGDALIRQHKYREARQYFQEIHYVTAFGFPSLFDEHGTFALHQLGTIAMNTGQYEEAEKYFRESLEITLNTGATLHVLQTFHQLGVLYLAKGNLEEAKSYFYKSLELSEPLDYKEGILRSYDLLGNTFFKAKELNMAHHFISKSLKIKLDLNSGVKEILISMQTLAMISKENGDIVEEKSIISDAFSLAYEAGSANLMVELLYPIYLEEYESFVVDLLTSTFTFEFNADTANEKLKCELDVLILISTRLLNLKKYSLFNKLMSISIRNAEQYNLSEYMSANLNLLGLQAYDTSQIEIAIRFFSENIKKYSEISNKVHVARSLQTLAVIYIGLEEYDFAENLLLKRIDIANNHKSIAEFSAATSYNSLASVYYRKEKFFEAVKLLEKGIEEAIKVDDLMIGATILADADLVANSLFEDAQTLLSSDKAKSQNLALVAIEAFTVLKKYIPDSAKQIEEIKDWLQNNGLLDEFL